MTGACLIKGSHAGQRNDRCQQISRLRSNSRLTKLVQGDDLQPARILTAEDEDAGQRIDNFLTRHLKGVPRSRIYQMLRRGEVRINGGRAKPTTRLTAGDGVRIPPVHLATPDRPASGSVRLAATLEAAVLYEDDGLLILNKPAGIAVHGGSGVASAVVETMREHRSAPGFELVHRLDRDTSGCLALAKRRAALRQAQELLREREATKRYVAVVHGIWQRGTISIDLPLSRSQRGNERVVRVSADGVAATTIVEKVIRGDGWTALGLRLVTGRTHQIRVHLAYLGHPILGDDKYGAADHDAERWAAGWTHRLYLHAFGLQLGHISVQAPLPDAFVARGLSLERLGKQP